jgi:hypothetical protein
MLMFFLQRYRPSFIAAESVLFLILVAFFSFSNFFYFSSFSILHGYGCANAIAIHHALKASVSLLLHGVRVGIHRYVWKFTLLVAGLLYCT